MKFDKNAKNFWIVMATNEDYLWIDVVEDRESADAVAKGSWRVPLLAGYRAEVLGPFTAEELRRRLSS